MPSNSRISFARMAHLQPTVEDDPREPATRTPSGPPPTHGGTRENLRHASGGARFANRLRRAFGGSDTPSASGLASPQGHHQAPRQSRTSRWLSGMAFCLDPSMYYMLNSHNHFSTVGNNQFRQDTAQQFLHSLGYTTVTPGRPHYGVPPGHHHDYDAPPPYSPPGVPPPQTHGGPGFPYTAFGTGQRISIGQLQTNIYNGFMQNLGLDPHQHTPYRPQFVGAGGAQTPSGPNAYANLADLQTNIYNGFMQNFRAHTQAVGLSDASWYGSGGWTNAWHMPYPHFTPQSGYTHRFA